MKRILITMFAIIMLFTMTVFLTACSEVEDTPAPTPVPVETLPGDVEETNQEDGTTDSEAEGMMPEVDVVDGSEYFVQPDVQGEADDFLRYTDEWFFAQEIWPARDISPQTLSLLEGNRNHTIEDFERLFGVGMEQLDVGPQFGRREMTIEGNEVTIRQYELGGNGIVASLFFTIVEGTNLHDETTSVAISVPDLFFADMSADIEEAHNIIVRNQTEIEEMVSHAIETSVVNLSVVERLTEITGLNPRPFRWRADVGFYAFGWMDMESRMLVRTNAHDTESNFIFLIRPINWTNNPGAEMQSTGSLPW